jgi:hypothetical protein
MSRRADPVQRFFARFFFAFALPMRSLSRWIASAGTLKNLADCIVEAFPIGVAWN